MVIRMVEIEELVRFLRRGKTSEADIRLRFGTCPRKLLKELVEEKLIYKSINPTRYYATPINKMVKAKIKLMERGIVSDKNIAVIHSGTEIPPGKGLKKSEFPINVEAWNDKEVAKIAESLWDNPEPKKDGWFKRLLKRNAKH